jgi:hypothetical protein
MKCTCIVAHPQTDEERTEVVKNLEYFRSIGDTRGAMIALAQLAFCPARDEPETDAVNDS